MCRLLLGNTHGHHLPHYRQHYTDDNRLMLQCHTTIRGRKNIVIEIEGVGRVDLNLECLFIKQTPRRLHLEANNHANAEYRRGQEVISETAYPSQSKVESLEIGLRDAYCMHRSNLLRRYFCDISSRCPNLHSHPSLFILVI